LKQARNICETEYLENKLEITDESKLNADVSNSLISLNAISTGKENEIETKTSLSYFDEMMMRQPSKQTKTKSVLGENSSILNLY
jgi:hypothetical protein